VTVATLTRDHLAETLAGPGLRVRTGPFAYRVRTDLPELVDLIHLLYADFPLWPEDLVDFEVRLSRTRRRAPWQRRALDLELDGITTHRALPRSHVSAYLDWSLNWCICGRAPSLVLLHAAVLERPDGSGAVLMPAASGSGKSTLCAALACRGWRLLTDELAVLRVGSSQVLPLARPVSLKNRSIDAIRAFAPDRPLGPVAAHPRDGTVAYLLPPADSVRRCDEPARPAWIVFPRYRVDAPALLRPAPKAGALFRLIGQLVGAPYLDSDRFAWLADLVDRSPCFDLTYSALEDGVAAVEAATAAAP
jgi:hypothetical protein